jgi:hypothetical protein
VGIGRDRGKRGNRRGGEGREGIGWDRGKIGNRSTGKIGNRSRGKMEYLKSRGKIGNMCEAGG